MKNTWNAAQGFLPSAEKSTKPTTRVASAAITGDSPPRRLRGDHPFGLLADLAPDDVLLQIASGEAARGGVGSAGLHLVLADRRFRVRAHGVGADEAARDEALAVRGEQRVFGERHFRHRAAPETLLGHEAQNLR